jgi:hypothetical protein
MGFFIFPGNASGRYAQNIDETAHLDPVENP